MKHLDFNLIENNPKIFIGYSDITILHYALLKKANLQTFY
ncbi:MAG: LD-carboxypeptidase [Candidatus Peribacteria bacterium]|nr:LD-carboxypeptidase [Candidatus Peribacteria bacterium]